jgi:hypothetical protein
LVTAVVTGLRKLIFSPFNSVLYFITEKERNILLFMRIKNPPQNEADEKCGGLDKAIIWEAQVASNSSQP